jgi:hypothetical protein
MSLGEVASGLTTGAVGASFGFHAAAVGTEAVTAGTAITAATVGSVVFPTIICGGLMWAAYDTLS